MSAKVMDITDLDKVIPHYFRKGHNKVVFFLFEVNSQMNSPLPVKGTGIQSSSQVREPTQALYLHL